MRGCACRGTAGFALVSCLAEQAKILVAEVEESNLAGELKLQRWGRWSECSLCEQEYHGVVAHALGWACWKTYVGRPEENPPRQLAMNTLGNGLDSVNHDEDALSMCEALLSTLQRVGAPEEDILTIRANVAKGYSRLGRLEQSLELHREVYARLVILKSDRIFLNNGLNLSVLLFDMKRYGETKAFLRKLVPKARRTLGADHETCTKLHWNYADALFRDNSASRDDIVEAVSILDELHGMTRRVYGTAHPVTEGIQRSLTAAQKRRRGPGTPGAAGARRPHTRRRRRRPWTPSREPNASAAASTARAAPGRAAGPETIGTTCAGRVMSRVEGVWALADAIAMPYVRHRHA